MFRSSCRYDYVEVRNGGTELSPVLGRFCGHELPSTQVSTGNVMYIRFRTDGSIATSGFNIKYMIGMKWLCVQWPCLGCSPIKDTPSYISLLFELN